MLRALSGGPSHLEGQNAFGRMHDARRRRLDF
jgi:hypothetical protein